MATKGLVSFGKNEIDEELGEQGKPSNQIHIRFQQRNGRKCLTIIQGIPVDIDLKKVLKYFKKAFSCNGTIVTEEETNEKIVQLSGDNRSEVAQFLIENGIGSKENVKIHGH